MVNLEPGKPQEEAHQKKHQATQADGKYGEPTTSPMSRRKCPKQQDDRGNLANENRRDTIYHKQLAQTASQRADPCRLLCPNANQRVAEANQGRDPRRPRQRHAPPEAPFVQIVHNQLYFRPLFSATRAFTILFNTAAGNGLSRGNRMVPFEIVKSPSSSVKASITA